jgi:hypothetical protein
MSNPSPPPMCHLKESSTMASEPSGKPEGCTGQLAGKTMAPAISASGMSLLFVAVNSGGCERLKDDRLYSSTATSDDSARCSERVSCPPIRCASFSSESISWQEKSSRLTSPVHS